VLYAKCVDVDGCESLRYSIHVGDKSVELVKKQKGHNYVLLIPAIILLVCLL
jgi:hypothetical protein